MVRNISNLLARHLAWIVLLAFATMFIPASYAQSAPANYTKNSTGICGCLNGTQIAIIANENVSEVGYAKYNISLLGESNSIAYYVYSISSKMAGSDSLSSNYKIFKEKISLSSNFTSAEVERYVNLDGGVAETEVLMYSDNAAGMYNSLLTNRSAPMSYISGNLTYYPFGIALSYGNASKTSTALSIFGLEKNVLVFFTITSWDGKPLQAPSAIAQYMGYALQPSPQQKPNTTASTSVSGGRSTSILPVRNSTATSVPQNKSGNTPKGPNMVFIGIGLVLVIVILIAIGIAFSRSRGGSISYPTAPSSQATSPKAIEKEVRSDMKDIGPVTKSEKMLAGYEKSLERAPTNHRLYYNKGHLLSKMGKGDEAVSEYNRAIKLDPKNPKYHLAKAMQLRKLGKDAEADKEYEVATKLAYEKIEE